MNPFEKRLMSDDGVSVIKLPDNARNVNSCLGTSKNRPRKLSVRKEKSQDKNEGNDVYTEILCMNSKTHDRTISLPNLAAASTSILFDTEKGIVLLAAKRVSRGTALDVDCWRFRLEDSSVEKQKEAIEFFKAKIKFQNEILNNTIPTASSDFVEAEGCHCDC
jgi:hypothetical protein